ncbi:MULTISPECIES: DUF262 domain-containing protein [Delftia]|uniref:DUF262 domain-containing protein n=1 Tax=Delftia deserti TaxID=1651218 RepID=A0ABW5EIW0_9BURK
MNSIVEHKFPDTELTELGQSSGVEYEPVSEMEEPFDPASISIDTRVIALDHVLRRLRQGTIRLAPSFQRKYIWDEPRKSRLIESLMLRIPLPMFYVAANHDGTWDVVDGLQRLTTIRDFLIVSEKSEYKSLKLAGLEFWGDRFNGKTFAEIESMETNSRVVNNILETEMRFTVINPGTPEEVKRNIFKRINTGGMPLTLQEIRHALYQGPATDLLAKLVESDSFLNAVDNSIDDSRMAGRELILRFLAFYMFDHTNGFDGDMDKLLSNVMRVINCLPNVGEKEMLKIFKDAPVPELIFRDIGKVEIAFGKAMIRGKRFFGEDAFRKGTSESRRTPVNKALFEAWSKIFAAMKPSEFRDLCSNKADAIKEYKKILTKDSFERAISRDSTSGPGVRERYRVLDGLVKKWAVKYDL